MMRSSRNSLRIVATIFAVLCFVRSPLRADPAAGADLIDRSGETLPLDLTFRDEEGRPFLLKEKLARPAILSLNYYECKSICTPMLGDLAEALEKVPLEPGRDYDVITVSIDPEETPSLAIRKKRSLLAPVVRPGLSDSWHFLTGDKNSIARLAEGAGFVFAPQGDGFLHPGALVILSKNGKIIRYINGRHYLPLDLEMAVTEASLGRVGQTIRKTLLTCFRYDPQQKRYVLDITRVGGAVILSGAALLLFIARRRRGGTKR